MAEDRRTLLKVLTGVLGGGAAAAVGLPVVRALLAPIGHDTVSGAGDFLPLASVEAIPEDGTPIKVSVVIERPRDAWAILPPTQVGAVYLAKKGPEVLAYSTVCPHLGCGVDYDPDTRMFACPCHESAFGLDGAVSGGPSPRGLDRLEARVLEGRVEVRYQRFEQGKKEKIVT